MSASILGLSVLLAVGAMAVLYFALSQHRKATRPGQKPRRTKPSVEPPPESATVLYPFRATSILPGDVACSAAHSMAGTRFLVQGNAIPHLPLTTCDVAECSCRYVKFRDRRRVRGDRRDLGGSQLHLLTQQEIGERRSGRERRAA